MPRLDPDCRRIVFFLGISSVWEYPLSGTSVRGSKCKGEVCRGDWCKCVVVESECSRESEC